MKQHTLPYWVVNLFFVCGLLAAVLFRLLIFVNAYYPAWSRLVWYGGVIGYLLFFGFRYYITHKRREVIKHGCLIDKVKVSDMQQEDKDDVVYVLKSILKSKEMINYIFIFTVSLIAILVDIVLVILEHTGAG